MTLLGEKGQMTMNCVYMIRERELYVLDARVLVSIKSGKTLN